MKKFEITKQQINTLNKIRSAEVDKYLKEWFPDSFKKELEVGKWYKNPSRKSLMYFYEINGNTCLGYGFDNIGIWNDKLEFFTNYWQEATPQEAESALICEAEKRGLLDGSYYVSPKGYKRIVKYPLKLSDDVLIDANRYFIFSSGKWATIIETITKEEAEKLLNKKIV